MKKIWIPNSNYLAAMTLIFLFFKNGGYTYFLDSSSMRWGQHSAW